MASTDERGISGAFREPLKDAESEWSGKILLTGQDTFSGAIEDRYGESRIRGQFKAGPSGILFFEKRYDRRDDSVISYMLRPTPEGIEWVGVWMYGPVFRNARLSEQELIAIREHTDDMLARQLLDRKQWEGGSAECLIIPSL